MDKRFKVPLLIMTWAAAICIVMFAIFFIWGMYLGFTDPAYLME